MTRLLLCSQDLFFFSQLEYEVGYPLIFFLLVCLFFEGGRGRERGRERIPSRLHAVSAEPDAGLELTNCEIMT